MIWWRDASLPRLFGVHVCSIGGCPCRVVAAGNPSALSGPSVCDRLCARTLPRFNNRGMAGSGTLLEEIGAGAPVANSCAYSLRLRRSGADVIRQFFHIGGRW